MKKELAYLLTGRKGRKLYTTVALLLGVIVLTAGDPTITSALLDEEGEPVITASSAPFSVLSDADKVRYREAASLELAGKSTEAQARLEEVHDPLLVADISRLPTQKASSETIDANTTTAEVHHTKTMLHDMGGLWEAGLDAYRKNDMSAAAEHFSDLFEQTDDLDSEDRAAVAFWAYRSFLAADDKDSAAYYVKQASHEAPGFYSILARQVISDNAWLHEDITPQIIPLMVRPEIRHVLALKEVGQEKAASNALYNIYTNSDAKDQEPLMTLAALINLPAAKMRMMLDSASETEAQNRDLYPIPHWTPSSGYHVDPALLFAIMRQESAFNPHAVSAGGAMGVMQLMPQTADSMARAAHLKGLSNSLPEVSMALGQIYLKRLMQNNEVGNNLIFLTASYNAGPLNVAHWKHTLHYGDDALLFLESIPFTQTRDYVVNVLGNYWVYGQLLGSSNASPLAALSRGEWPQYAGVNTATAQLMPNEAQ